MRSAPGRFRRAAPGSSSFAPRMPAPMHTSSVSATAPSTQTGQSAGNRGDAAVLHAGFGDSELHRGEGSLAHVEPAAGHVVHVHPAVRQRHAAGLALLATPPAQHEDGVRHHVGRQVVDLAQGFGVGVGRVDLEHQRGGHMVADGGQHGLGQQVGALQGRHRIQAGEHGHGL